LTITPENSESVPSLLNRLSKVGVQAISLSINAPGLEADLDKARDYVANLDLPLIWDLPVPYSALNPVTLEVQSEDQPEGAGKAWLYIEPDGDVLPAQGVNQVLGNILRDPWAQIWENAAQF
jgi:MoaA/NifB/PqqE/SkfB family radical SAM enzyme